LKNFLVNVQYQIQIKNGRKILIIIVNQTFKSIKIFLYIFFNLGLDGGTSSLERERLINAFNTPNSPAKLFLLSTR
jgi:SNF2 family DNA or RNA helicase